MPPCEMPRRLLPSSSFRWTNCPAKRGKPWKAQGGSGEQATASGTGDFLHESGFLGPIDLLSQDEVAEVRRHVEEIEAKLGAKMMSRFRIKAHLPFPSLCDLVSHRKAYRCGRRPNRSQCAVLGIQLFPEGAGGQDIRLVASGLTYYGLKPPNTLTAWIAISEASIAAGCMRFLPGSHNKGIHSHDELKAKDNLLSRGQTVKGIDESKAVHVPLRAGQFSFHKEDTLHASHPNSTNDRRIGLSIHYVSPDVRETNFPGASAICARQGHARLLEARDEAPGRFGSRLPCRTGSRVRAVQYCAGAPQVGRLAGSRR